MLLISFSQHISYCIEEVAEDGFAGGVGIGEETDGEEEGGGDYGYDGDAPADECRGNFGDEVADFLAAQFYFFIV